MLDEIYGEPKRVVQTENVRLDRQQWAEDHGYCAVCWISESRAALNRFPAGLQTHELVGGSMRSLEPYNYLRLCSACHQRYHSGTPYEDLDLDFGHLLYCKYEQACVELGYQFPPGWIIEGVWNWHRLGYLYSPQRRPVSAACLPPMESVPTGYLAERLKWNPYSRCVAPLGEKPCHNLDLAAHARAGEHGILLLKKPDGFKTFSPGFSPTGGVLGDLLTTPGWNSIFSSVELTHLIKDR